MSEKVVIAVDGEVECDAPHPLGDARAGAGPDVLPSGGPTGEG